MQKRYKSLMKRPWGVTGLIAFFVFATLISGTSALTLAFPGTPLDAIWRLKPAAREGFASLGTAAPVLLTVLCVFMVVTATGLWRRRPWGWWTALIAITINFFSDAVHSFFEPTNLIGLPIAALVIWYLLRPPIRQYFRA